jgi:tryptophan synthase beta chain
VFNDFFGPFGGRYVAEVLRAPLDELEQAFVAAMKDPAFFDELALVQKEYIGRPTPMLYARNASAILGGAQIYVKLEGLANTGAHKINNAAGQILLAKRMGKKRIIAETGAGQHGVATAAVCAKFGFDCTVYMGEVDIARQRPNVYLMELYGAKVVPVSSGSRTLKDAVNEALRDWAASFADTHYLLGSALGPSPFPDMVREFQSVIGREVVEQTKGLDVAAMIACVGGGSNSIGFFEPFIDKKEPRLIGVEAGGYGQGTGRNAVRMGGDARPGVVQGYKSFFLLDDDGQVQDTHSVSAGLDYAGIGPQLAQLGKEGRVEFTSALDSEVIDAVKFFARNEGVVFALESAHAGAVAMKLAPTLPKDKALIVNMSGRGDKDIFISAKVITPEPWVAFLKSEVEHYEQSKKTGEKK